MKFFIMTIIGSIALFCLWAVIDDYIQPIEENQWELEDH